MKTRKILYKKAIQGWGADYFIVEWYAISTQCECRNIVMEGVKRIIGDTLAPIEMAVENSLKKDLTFPEK